MSSRDTMVHLEGEQLRDARRKKNISQDQLVKRVKVFVAENNTARRASGQSGEPAEQAPDYAAVSLATLKQIEAGHRPSDGRPTLINLNIAQAIARVLVSRCGSSARN